MRGFKAGLIGACRCKAVVEIGGPRPTQAVSFGDPALEPLLGGVSFTPFSVAPDPVLRQLVPVEALLM